MQPEQTQPESSPSERNNVSRSNISRRTSDRLKSTASEQPESSDARSTARRTLTRNSPQQGSSREITPTEGMETIKYTRTGRVSRANKGKRVHECEECGKIYTRAEHLRRHQQNHKPGAFPCDVPGCDRSFFREDLLLRHKARHNDAINTGTALSSPGSQYSEPMAEIGETLPPYSSGRQQVSSSVETESTHSSPQRAGGERRQSRATDTSARKRPANTHTSYAHGIALSVNGQLEYENGGYISDSSVRYSSTGATSPINSYLNGPYYHPFSDRTRQSSSASLQPYHLPVHTSASPVSGESSTTYPPYWINGDHEAVFQYLANIPTFAHQYTHGVEDYNHNLIDMSLMPECRDLEEKAELAVHMISPESSWNLNFDEPLSSNEQRYLEAFWNHVHPLFPVVHRPSFNPYDASPLLKASMVALGAQSLGAATDKTNARLLHEKSIKVLKKRTSKDSHSSRICDLQAIVLFEVYSIFKSRRPLADFSSYFENAYELLAADAEALEGSSIVPNYYQEMAFEDEFSGSMFFPTEAECKRRLLAACYMLDQQCALLFGRTRSQAFSRDGNSPPFPKSQASWDASVHGQGLSELVRWPVHTVEGQRHLDEHMHDVFQSMHLVGSFFDSRKEAALAFTFGPSDDPTTLPIVEHSPRIQLTYHTLALCESIPMRDLLAVAGETWIMSEKLTREEEYINAQATSRSWATNRRDSVAGLSNRHPQQVQRALAHALKILEIHRAQPKTGVLFQEWAVYLASIVVWAKAYAVSTENVRFTRLAERSTSLSAQERAVSALLAAGPDHDTTLDEAMSILLWTKSKIESIDSPHNCGLTNMALDVLRKLVAKGAEPGWF